MTDTTDTDTLRPEVREALTSIEFACTVRYSGEDEYAIIRAELLRLAHDSAEHAAWRDINERARFDQQQRAEKAEAELAALKARIAKPVDRSHKYVQSKEHGGCSECGYPEWEPWHRVALVKAEESGR